MNLRPSDNEPRLPQMTKPTVAALDPPTRGEFQALCVEVSGLRAEVTDLRRGSEQQFEVLRKWVEGRSDRFDERHEHRWRIFLDWLDRARKEAADRSEKQWSEIQKRLDAIRAGAAAEFAAHRKETTQRLDTHRQDTARRFEAHREETTQRFNAHREETTQPFEAHREETAQRLTTQRGEVGRGIGAKADDQRTGGDGEIEDRPAETSGRSDSRRSEIEECEAGVERGYRRLWWFAYVILPASMAALIVKDFLLR